MSPATLPRFPALDLDYRRIAGTSATIAVHLLALMLLLTPVQWSPPTEQIEETPPYVPYEEKVPEPIVPPPEPQPREIVRTQSAPRTPPIVMEQLESAAIDQEVDLSAQADTDAIEDGAGGDDFEIAPPSGPQRLAVSFGPAPPYPMVPLRQGVEGRVILRIEVDANGVPTGGVIENSSGSRLLDQAALKFVVAKWRFVPAMHQGQPIAATALVPIDFVLNQ